jgi:hypothetical protein
MLVEDKSASVPAGEAISIAVSHVFSNIPEQKLGIWHVDYVLYDSEGNEIQPQADTEKKWLLIAFINGYYFFYEIFGNSKSLWAVNL